MLPTASSYSQLVSEFRWNIPARYNMAHDVCGKWKETQPDRVAIIDLTGFERREVRFAELQMKANQIAGNLLGLGIKRGDRVGVYRTQSVWTAAAHIAVWQIGAVSMPLFKLFGEDALKTRLKDSGTKAVITDPDGMEPLLAIHQQLPDLRQIIIAEDLEKADAPDIAVAGTGPDDPAVLIYTSGTTGPPKGALHGHRILLGHLPGVEMSHDLFPKEKDVIWTPADWAWIGGLFDVLMPGLHHGVPVVASRMVKFNTIDCQEIIKKAGVRNIFFPPTALKMLKADNARISGLRTVGSGGEPLGAEMLNWGREAFGLTINEFYGQTECNMVVSSCSALFEPKAGFMGRPVPGHDVAVIDETGTSTTHEGDIAVKRGTPVMMLEYWNNPQATKDKFRTDSKGNQWLLTGDRGVMEGGDIRFIGRDDDVITSAGYRIGPAEIEDCLITHPAIATAGVIGKPDPQRTEIVKAYVILKSGFKPGPELQAQLQDHVKMRLAKYEYPREIEFVEELPMTVTGKIIRKELKRRAIQEVREGNS